MAQHLSSKNLLLSHSPLVVGVLPGRTALGQFVSMSDNEQAQECDLVELRLDLLGMSSEALLEEVEGMATPLLVTARHPAEGGQGPEEAAARVAMLEPFLQRAVLLDVELQSLAEMKGLMQAARAHGVGLVGSFHDFGRTPSDEVLEGAASLAEAAGVDLVKVATFLNSADDLARLVRFAGKERRLRVSVMGMGALGAVSRLVLAKCGSLLNYGYVGAESNAPGQWPARRLKAVLAEL
jgi:3-dehydroquinate dehydratase-1